MKANNILVIDDGLANSDESVNSGTSISYKKSMINNNYNYKPNLSDFLDIFKNKHDNIMSVDSSDVMTLIDINGNEWSMHKYQSDMNIIFFKITNPMLKKYDAEIYINAKPDTVICSQMYNRTIRWNDSIIDKTYAYTIDDVIEDSPSINGYNICKLIKYLYKKNKRPFFIGYCCRKPSFEYYKGISYRSYLPSAYQMMIICKHICIIKYFITDIMGEKIPESYKDVEQQHFWTCNEAIGNQAYYITSNTSDDKFDAQYNVSLKQCSAFVFPIYKPVEI